MNRVFTICCFFLITLSTKAQQHIFKTYTVEDGLVSNPIRNIYQDSKGFIWIATWEGLSKYDGHKFINYTTDNGLSHNMVNDLYESADGRLYVAENNGSVDILQNDAIVKKAAFSNVIINEFYLTSSKKLIAATDTSGLYEIHKEKLVKPTQAFPHSTFNDIIELNNSFLIGGSDKSIRILNSRYDLISEIKQPKDFLIIKMFKDSRKKIWVGTNTGLKLLSAISNTNPHFKIQHNPFNIPALHNQRINDMLEDDHGNLWVATQHGLLKIQPGNTWQIFLQKNGLPADDITCLYQDSEKNIWIGTSQGVAKVVTKNDIRIYTVENGFNSNEGVLFLMPVNNDELLIGMQHSIKLYDVTNGHFSLIKSLPNILYTGVVQNSSPLLLFNQYSQFANYDKVKHVIKKNNSPKQPTSLICSVTDENGIIFNGAWNGLIIIAGKKAYNDKTLPYRINNILIDKKGYLWAGTHNNGLYRIKYTITTNKFDISLSVKNFSYLLPDKNIRSLFEDSKGNIWIGTRYKGLVRLKAKNNNAYTSQCYDANNGLSSNWIRAIAEDGNGNVWIGSIIGIDKLITENNTFRIFNFSRINNFFATIHSIFPFSNNSLWFATDKGIVNIKDGETEKFPPLPVYITSVTLSDSIFNYNEHRGSKVVLKHNRNQVAVEFSSPGFINEKQILYSYRLTGSADTTWSKPANLHNVSYASLQPGNYHFEVRTIGWNGEPGIPANFAFIIHPPYWQTWWFYLLIGVVVILLFYSIYRYRVTQLMKVQKVRNRIASDLHDDIGSTLTNINMLSEISRKNLKQPKEAEKFLYRISEEVTASSQALNDIIWSVNTVNDSFEETLSRMRRYAAELFDNTNIMLHLNMNEDVAAKKLNMEQRRDVYLIFKEIMNNIVKHAFASNVWMNALLHKGNLLLKIKDDGKGFDNSGVSKGNGLKNIRSRTKKWKGTIMIETSPGNGTLIEIIIPMQE